ncbi:predicted protein [Naegleria gruberi]|uniref:Predicted protein n=1 Tax=Naegleria gruberi TaxID=5762 RepID=D2VQ77_NAEGR|nr:uncharacterized protein NAEGRDRAFT_71052 [Naegleria gruberi]EFC40998.1 predicted protein [Naegleria gruberi]|eukprot:XP_002673742.1 predicted protein [Naegleria gruberi strain NEG-M]
MQTSKLLSTSRIFLLGSSKLFTCGSRVVISQQPIFQSTRPFSTQLNKLCSESSIRKSKPSFKKEKSFGASSSEKKNKPINMEKKDFQKNKVAPSTIEKKEKKLTYSPEEKSHYFQQIIFPLRKALKERNIEKCLWFFESEAPKYLVSIPIQETNEMLVLLGGVGNFKKAYEMYSKVLEKYQSSGGAKPDINTVESLFFAAKQNRDLSSLNMLKRLEVVLLDDMEALNLKLNNRIFHDLIAVILYGLRGSHSADLKSALNGEEVRGTPYLELTSKTILELYNKLTNKTKFVHTTMIQYLQKMGDVEYIFHIYDELKKGENSVALDTTFYNTLIMCLISNKFETYDDVLFMFEVYREMVEVGGCKPSCHTYNMMLSALKVAHEKNMFENRIESSTIEPSFSIVELYRKVKRV